MTRSLLGLLLAAMVASAPAVNATLLPFQSVILQGDEIVATLPENTRWLVESPPTEPRLSKRREVFRLSDGQSLRLVERHFSYRITARISVEHTFDAHSFGAATTVKKYFIQAR
jgi:hypothetical protein